MAHHYGLQPRSFMRPVEPGAGQQPGGASVQPGMHPVVVEFDFLQPLRSVGWLVDELGELRFDPIRQRGRLRPLPSQQRACHV